MGSADTTDKTPKIATKVADRFSPRGGDLESGHRSGAFEMTGGGKRSGVASFVVGLLGVLGCAAPAFAQGDLLPQQPEQMDVASRPHPELDPLGIRAGGFFLYPNIAVGETYNDNIFATATDKKSDFITTISPSVLLRSNWSNHEVHALAEADIGRYASHDDEDYKDYRTLLGGRLDVRRDTQISGNVGYSHQHEDRSSPDDVRGLEPTTYDKAAADAAFMQRFNRFAARVELQGNHLNYDDVPTSTGTIFNSDRDRYETESALRLSYDFLPNYSVFVRGAYRQNIYDQDRDRNGFDRNSTGYKIDTGVAVDLTGVLTVEAHAGYLSTDFDDARLETVQGLSAGVLGTWNVTRLTTVKVDINRDVHPTTLNGAAAELDTGGFVSVDHELLRNLILSGRLGYTRSTFEGINRDDDNYAAGLSARYLIARGVALTGSYTYDDRASNVSFADYKRNLVMLRLSYGL